MKIKRLNEILKTEREKKIVDDIIKQLKNIDIDGESLQNIIEEIGMDDQMLTQLVRSYPKHAISEFVFLYEDLMNDDRKELDDFLLDRLSENPDFHEKMSELLMKLDAKKYNL